MSAGTLGGRIRPARRAGRRCRGAPRHRVPALVQHPDVHDALGLVEDAGHPAGGIVIDVWHVERAETSPDELAALPLHRIVGVELNDADREVVGTLFEDTVTDAAIAAKAPSTWPA